MDNGPPQVHYTGYLLETGAKFDSSKERGTPFVFTIGKLQCYLWQGWDQSVPRARSHDLVALARPRVHNSVWAGSECGLALDAGVGEVIKCWDEGIKQLSKGAAATLTCTAGCSVSVSAPATLPCPHWHAHPPTSACQRARK